MESTAAGVVCLDFVKICKRAIGTLQRRGICGWIERDELLAEGYLALSAVNPETEALGVVVARRAMFHVIRGHERRERGRVEVRIAGADDPAEGDCWDATIHGGQSLQPANTHPDVWEAMKALPSREYLVISLVYWGGKTQAEVAIELGVSQQRVAQILLSAEKKMRESLVNRASPGITNMRGERSSEGRPVGRNGEGVGR